MTNTPVAVTAEAPPRSLLGRFFGIITSPQATFRSVVAHPKVFGMLALICLGMALLVGGFLNTKTGQLAWLDAATTSSLRGPATPEQLAAMEKIAPYAWMFEETSFLGRLLGMVDLFIIWWLVVLAIGLGVLFRRRTQPIAVSLMAVYAVIAVVVAIVRSRMGGA